MPVPKEDFPNICEALRTVGVYRTSPMPIAALSLSESNHELSMSYTSHVSLWDISDLENFVDFMSMCFLTELKILNKKWEFHQKNNVAGGVCDMTIMYLWANKVNGKKPNQIVDISTICQDKWMFNDNINYGTSDKDFGMLPITKKFGQYYLIRNKQISKPLPFIHFQGRAKPILTLINFNMPISIAIPLILILKRIISMIKNIIQNPKTIYGFKNGK